MSKTKVATATLTLHKLNSWSFDASVEGVEIADIPRGCVFELGYMDVDDFMEEHGITKLVDLSGDY